MQHLLRLWKACRVRSIDYEENGVGVVVVQFPRRPQLFLPAEVPAGEGDAMVCLGMRDRQRLCVAAKRRLGRDGVPQLQVVKNRGLARVV